MCIKCESKTYRAQPDVYFHPSHRMMVKVLTNVAENPDNTKFRSLNMHGNAFAQLNIPGALAFLAYAGWVVDGDNLVLKTYDADKLAEALAHVLHMPELREQSRIRAEAEAAVAKQQKEKEDKELLKARFMADRRETSQRPVVASVSQTVPFNGATPKGFSDVGVDLNKGGGG